MQFSFLNVMDIYNIINLKKKKYVVGISGLFHPLPRLPLDVLPMVMIGVCEETRELTHVTFVRA